MAPIVCPKCSKLNRSGAHFCNRCRAPLLPDAAPHTIAPSAGSQPTPRQMTQKICPTCSTVNRLDAGFCKTCGRTFTQSAATRRVGWMLWPGIGVAVALLVIVVVMFNWPMVRSNRNDEATATLTGVAAAELPLATRGLTETHKPLLPEPTSITPDTLLDRNLLATVQILTPMDGVRDRWSTGSGSVITSQGHVLTNYHVLGDPDSGLLFNRDGVVLIAVSSVDERAEPEITYRAEIQEVDRDSDLALLKIVALEDDRPLPPDFAMVTMPLGDSDTVRIGDELTILGYPGLGGQSITLTRGSVSGFLAVENFIKTDAEINPGNSGGAAVNKAGELIGIPTAGAVGDQFPGKLGLVRPVNQARSLIDRALREASEMR